MSNRSPSPALNGCQNLSTGLLGSLLIVALVGACIDFRMGLAQPLLLERPFPWIPGSGMDVVNREVLSLLASLGLGALLMAAWERAAPRQRILVLTGLMVSATIPWVATLAGGSPWIELGVGRLSRLEAGLLASYAFSTAVVVAVALPRWRGARLAPVGWALRTAFWRWLAGLVPFTAVVMVSLRTPLYGAAIFEVWRFTCCALLSIYLFLGLPYAFLTNLWGAGLTDNLSDPGFVICLLARSRRRLRALRRPSVRVTLLDLVVKTFFIPVMTVSFFLNVGFLVRAFIYQAVDGSYVFVTQNATSFAFGLIGTMDISLGLLGYTCASRWLGNKTRSVDPSIGGWLVTLLCYPPLNFWTVGRLPLQEGPPVAAQVGIGLQVISFAAFCVYVASTLAFGLRFSNLTYRGLIARGPYAVVRHPAYASKIIGWWAESARNIDTLPLFLIVVMVDGLYVLRAITEERHLMRFEEYRDYCARVKFRFIPGVL